MNSVSLLIASATGENPVLDQNMESNSEYPVGTKVGYLHSKRDKYWVQKSSQQKGSSKEVSINNTKAKAKRLSTEALGIQNGINYNQVLSSKLEPNPQYPVGTLVGSSKERMNNNQGRQSNLCKISLKRGSSMHTMQGILVQGVGSQNWKGSREFSDGKEVSYETKIQENNEFEVYEPYNQTIPQSNLVNKLNNKALNVGPDIKNTG